MAVEGLASLVANLRKRAAKARKDDAAVVAVGYTAEYGIYVHENLQAYHKVGQAKFLEQPARENAKEYGQAARSVVQKGGSLADGLLVAGLRLQRDSQELVPIDTGNLKASAFTRLE